MLRQSPGVRVSELLILGGAVGLPGRRLGYLRRKLVFTVIVIIAALSLRLEGDTPRWDREPCKARREDRGRCYFDNQFLIQNSYSSPKLYYRTSNIKNSTSRDRNYFKCEQLVFPFGTILTH